MPVALQIIPERRPIWVSKDGAAKKQEKSGESNTMFGEIISLQHEYTLMQRLFSGRKDLLFLSLLLLFKAVWALSEISIGYINLAPDEAQYWTWSQYLDWGYYSKPPGIAWQIYIGCQIFGNTELGVRFMSVIFSILSAFAIYYLAFCSGLQRITAFFIALVLTFSPIGLLGNFAATTDGGLILFWILTCCPICYALTAGKKPNYYLIGFLIFLGALFKWPIYILWIPILLTWFFYSNMRFFSIIVGFIISLCGLIPSFIWNLNNEWATFKHVFTQSTGGHRWVSSKPLFHGNFWEFFGAQFAILSPILFILLLLALFLIIKKAKQMQPAILFSGGTCILILFFFLISSIFNKMQPTWALYAYPTGVIALGWYAVEYLKKGIRWINYGLTLSIIQVFLLLIIPFLQQNNLLTGMKIPYKINPFRHSLGWSYLTHELNQAGYKKENSFLFADSYQMSSILSFYAPGQELAYFLNLDGKRKNQFSYWPRMNPNKIGQTGYYVWSQNSDEFLKEIDARIQHHKEKLMPYFHEVEFMGIAPLFYSYGTLVKGALIFKCINYNGLTPKTPDHY